MRQELSCSCVAPNEPLSVSAPRVGARRRSDASTQSKFPHLKPDSPSAVIERYFAASAAGVGATGSSVGVASS